MKSRQEGLRDCHGTRAKTRVTPSSLPFISYVGTLPSFATPDHCCTDRCARIMAKRTICAGWLRLPPRETYHEANRHAHLRPAPDGLLDHEVSTDGLSPSRDGSHGGLSRSYDYGLHAIRPQSRGGPAGLVRADMARRGVCQGEINEGGRTCRHQHGGGCGCPRWRNTIWTHRSWINSIGGISAMRTSPSTIAQCSKGCSRRR